MKLIITMLLASTHLMAQWGLNLALEQNFSKSGNDTSSSQELATYTHYNFPANGKLTLRLEALLNEGELSIKNPRLRFRNLIHEQGMFTFASDARIGIALTEETRKESSFLTHITWAPSVMANLSKKDDQTKFMIMYKPLMQRKIYDEEIAIIPIGGGVIAEEVLLRHQVNNLFLLNISFLKRFSLDFAYSYYMNWNVNGDRVDDTHEFWQELGVGIDDTFSLAFGHGNSLAAFDQDGENNKLTLSGNDGEYFYIHLNAAIDL